MTESAENSFERANRKYWDDMAETYHQMTHITCNDFHYGPLVPGDRELGLLPEPIEGLDCLELASGAGQNSIFLAKNGAVCTAIDLSDCQLDEGRRLAEEHKVDIDFRAGSIDKLETMDLGTYDLIHSSFGLPFVQNPQKVINDAAAMLKPGGTLLLSAAHPISSGEWLELDGEGEGIFLITYFEPLPDIRFDESSELTIYSRSYPISQTTDWFLEAGLHLTALLEPEAMPIETMSDEDIRELVPYYSEDWGELCMQFSRVPILVILRGQKPKT